MGRIRLTYGTYHIQSADKMLAMGREAASLLPDKTILALSGDLGAGKTTFVQGLASGLGILESVQSPTFVLLNLYEGLAHFDLYRLKNSAEFMNLGFDEYFDTDNIIAIEWPERIQEILPPHTLHVHFSYEQEGRKVIIS